MHEGETAGSAMEAVTQSYAKGETDEFILPTVVMENGTPTAVVGDGDSSQNWKSCPRRFLNLTKRSGAAWWTM